MKLKINHTLLIQLLFLSLAGITAFQKISGLAIPEWFIHKFENSFINLIKGGLTETNTIQPRIAILSSGYMLGRAFNAWKDLVVHYQISLYDLWKIKPVDSNQFKSLLSEYTHIITIKYTNAVMMDLVHYQSF